MFTLPLFLIIRLARPIYLPTFIQGPQTDLCRFLERGKDITVTMQRTAPILNWPTLNCHAR